MRRRAVGKGRTTTTSFRMAREKKTPFFLQAGKTKGRGITNNTGGGRGFCENKGKSFLKKGSSRKKTWRGRNESHRGRGRRRKKGENEGRLIRGKNQSRRKRWNARGTPKRERFQIDRRGPKPERTSPQKGRGGKNESISRRR